MNYIGLTTKTALKETDKFIANIPKYTDAYKGRGIVICAGGVTYFTNAWVTIKILRYLKCKLPIQLWYLDRSEMDERMMLLVKPFGVNCVNAREQTDKHSARILNGWELKSFALLNCPYKEVLLLDADNTPVQNPEFLFELPIYQETGALFWPDIGRIDSVNEIWKICGIPYKSEEEFESGQLVINKELCWKALNLTKWYNDYSDFFYRYIYGDKETFHLAFRKLNKSYFMNQIPLKSIAGVFVQHDFSGNVLFQHRTRSKWDLLGSNNRHKQLLLENESFHFLNELKRLWSGKIHVASIVS